MADGTFGAAVALLGAMIVTGCGGGSGRRRAVRLRRGARPGPRRPHRGPTRRPHGPPATGSSLDAAPRLGPLALSGRVAAGAARCAIDVRDAGGATLATTGSDATGDYAVTLADVPAGGVLEIAAGGCAFEDETSGEWVEAASLGALAVAPDAGAEALTVHVTPLTELARRLARANAAGGGGARADAAAVRDANEAVARAVLRRRARHRRRPTGAGRGIRGPSRPPTRSATTACCWPRCRAPERSGR